MAESVHLPCPQCGDMLSVVQESPGHEKRCPKCGATFTPTQDSPDTVILTVTDVPATHERAVGGDHIYVDWQPGDIILGTYEVRGLLGQGGMGKVHRVYHRKWDTELAVKSPAVWMDLPDQ